MIEWIKALKVGDLTWISPRKNGRGQEDGPCKHVVVTKVGRKYIKVKDADGGIFTFEHTFAYENGVEQGENSYYSRRMVENPEAYEEDKKRDELFSFFRRVIGYNCSPDVTRQNIRDAAALLKIELKEV